MSDIGREMTRTEMMVRISELAAERDAAIDARLTAEREIDTRVGERVANALLLRDQAAERMREREAYVFRRTAALLESTGYTTVERAAAEARRELAVVLGASC
jgi:hypothetical protein